MSSNDYKLCTWLSQYNSLIVGGPALSKTALLEKRVLEQKKAEALEKRKVYEQKVCNRSKA